MVIWLKILLLKEKENIKIDVVGGYDDVIICRMSEVVVRITNQEVIHSLVGVSCIVCFYIKSCIVF